MENLGLLLHEIEVDIENSYYQNVTEYEERIVKMKEIYPQKDIEDIEEAFNELKEDAEREYTYNTINNEVMVNTNDKHLAKDVVWDIVNSNIKNNY